MGDSSLIILILDASKLIILRIVKGKAVQPFLSLYDILNNVFLTLRYERNLLNF